MMRDMTHFTYKAELFQMGTRGGPRKLLADCVDGSGVNHVMAMTTISEEGSAIFKEESKRRLFSFILKDTITHPYICASSFVQLRDAKSVVINPYHSIGSLRDLIYSSADWKKKKITPKSKHVDKYNTAPGAGKPLDVTVIAKLGRQILEALFYLYLHGFPYPHLHSGNILINEHGMAQLSDLENSLLCLDPKLNREIRKLASSYKFDMAPEVIAFGHVLYEMALGHEKLDRSLKDVKQTCPAEIFPILESILEPTNIEAAATLKSLLRLPFFQEVTLEVTVHQTVLTEKWDERVRSLLKAVRATTAKICSPPVTPLLRSANSGIRLSDGVSTSHTTPSAASISSGLGKSRGSSSSTSASSSSSSSASLAKKQSSRNVSKSSGSSSASISSASSSVPAPPPPPPAGAPSPPPPPPPSMAKAMPAPQAGRDNLMAAIRAAGGLKSIQKDA